MKLTLDSFQANVLIQFLEAAYGEFANHCEPLADSDQTGETLADEIIIALGGEA